MVIHRHELQDVDGQGSAGFSQCEGNTESLFMLTAVIAHEERSTYVPGTGIAENAVLLDGHALF